MALTQIFSGGQEFVTDCYPEGEFIRTDKAWYSFHTIYNPHNSLGNCYCGFVRNQKRFALYVHPETGVQTAYTVSGWF